MEVSSEGWGGLNGGASGRGADKIGRWGVGVEEGEAHRAPRRFPALRTHDCVYGRLGRNRKVQVFSQTRGCLIFRFPGGDVQWADPYGLQRTGEFHTGLKSSGIL